MGGISGRGRKEDGRGEEVRNEPRRSPISAFLVGTVNSGSYPCRRRHPNSTHVDAEF